MCQIRGLFVTAREGRACLERGRGSPSLPYHFVLLCTTEGIVCAFIAFPSLVGRELKDTVILILGVMTNVTAVIIYFERPHH